jgi:hypothetical protein
MQEFREKNVILTMGVKVSVPELAAVISHPAVQVDWNYTISTNQKIYPNGTD